jgi:hypothetical protein
MKKFLSVVVAIVLVFAVLSMVSCTKKGTTTPTEPTPVPTVAFAFASGVSGWVIPSPLYTAEQALTAIGYNAADGHTANGCLSVTGNFNETTDGTDQTGSGGNDYSTTLIDEKGSISYTLPANITMTASTITAWIKVPASIASKTAGAYKAQLFVANDGNDVAHKYGYANSVTPVLLSTGSASSAGWISITGQASTFTGGISLDNVAQIGVQIYIDTTIYTAPDAVSNATIEFDDISYSY